jgi:mRNA-degrading endonuclease YafQ of YafQ-DinJ toxin-antitoxin module
MKVQDIYYDKRFEKQFRALPLAIKKKAVKAEGFFRTNPFHPSLRLHKLEGKLKELWSVSIDRNYRIIFKPLEEGVILFVSIGLHAIYEDSL